MTPNQPDKEPRQEATTKGENSPINQTGRDSSISNTRINFWILGLLATLVSGGLAWTLATGINNGGQNPQTVPSTSAPKK